MARRMPVTTLPAAGRPLRRPGAVTEADRYPPQANRRAEGGLPRPHDEAKAREAAGRRVAGAAKRLCAARDGERAGLDPS